MDFPCYVGQPFANLEMSFGTRLPVTTVSLLNATFGLADQPGISPEVDFSACKSSPEAEDRL
jgi:hypothetical protein